MKLQKAYKLNYKIGEKGRKIYTVIRFAIDNTPLEAWKIFVAEEQKYHEKPLLFLGSEEVEIETHPVEEKEVEPMKAYNIPLMYDVVGATGATQQIFEDVVAVENLPADVADIQERSILVEVFEGVTQVQIHLTRIPEMMNDSQWNQWLDAIYEAVGVNVTLWQVREGELKMVVR